MSSMTSNKQDIGLNRNTLDKFYTSKNIVEKCISFIKEKLDIKRNDLIIEPSAGNGSFIDLIKTLSCNYKFYDIVPQHVDIIKKDYLLLESKDFESKETGNKIHVIGNPPFGRQSSLAIKFIKKSCQYCHSISFILPKSFKKESLKKYFPLKYHLIYEYELPENSFFVGEKIHDVPCVFQIWEKKDLDRNIPEKIKPKGYLFVKQNENPDISFRRVGVYAGKIDRDTESKSFQSHYFIKFEHDLTDEVFETLASINYQSKNNTVGPKSISKQELIKEFNVFF
jgi:predicted RNA methylase